MGSDSSGCQTTRVHHRRSGRCKDRTRSLAKRSDLSGLRTRRRPSPTQARRCRRRVRLQLGDEGIREIAATPRPRGYEAHGTALEPASDGQQRWSTARQRPRPRVRTTYLATSDNAPLQIKNDERLNRGLSAGPDVRRERDESTQEREQSRLPLIQAR